MVPVNPMYKEQELSYFFRDSGAKLFLTLDEIASNLDLSFLKDTEVEQIITTSALDMLPAEASSPGSAQEYETGERPRLSQSPGDSG